MTPADLRAMAAEKDRAGRAALEQGDARAAAVAFTQAETCRAAADEMERLQGKEQLRSRSQERMVEGPMFSPEARVNMSRGTSTPAAARLAALGKKLIPPMSLAAIAEDAGISKSLLSMALKGDRAMPPAAAERIKERTGFPLSAWPKLG